MLLQFIQRSIPESKLVNDEDFTFSLQTKKHCVKTTGFGSGLMATTTVSYFVANALQFLFGSARPRLFKSTSNFG